MNAGDADKNVQWYQRAANSALVTRGSNVSGSIHANSLHGGHV